MRITQREHEVEKRLVNWAIIIPAFMAVVGVCWVVFAFGVRVAMQQVVNDVSQTKTDVQQIMHDVSQINELLKIKGEIVDEKTNVTYILARKNHN